MADQRLDTYINKVRTSWDTLVRMDKLAPTVLTSFAGALEFMNMDSRGSKARFRKYFQSYVPRTRSTLTEFRERATLNQLTSDPTAGGQQTSLATPEGYLEHFIESTYEWASEVEKTANIDALDSAPEQVTGRKWQIYNKSRQQDTNEACASEFLHSSNWHTPATAQITLGTNITAGATTFNITNAFKTSSGIAIGDLVRIGDRRKPSIKTGELETADAIQVLTVGTNDSGGAGFSAIGIQTTKSAFPKNANDLDSEVFFKLKVALSAHTAGTRVQINKPFAITTDNIDSVIHGAFPLIARENGLISEKVAYITPEILRVMSGSSTSGVLAPLSRNDILGADVLLNGDLLKYRGLRTISDDNAISHITAGNHIHYIWIFKPRATFSLGRVLDSSRVDILEGRAGLLAKISTFEFMGTITDYFGEKEGVIIPVTIT